MVWVTVGDERHEWSPIVMRPRLEIVEEADQWIVTVNGNKRRWFSTEAEAKAFVDGYDNAYDNHSTKE